MKEYKLEIINNYRNELMGIATILVFLDHSKKFEWIGKGVIIRSLQTLFRQGGIGVDIFLILSGIGLYMSLSRNDNIKEFYKRRFFRIIPTYLSIALIYYLWEWWYQKESILVFFSKISTISYWINGDGRFWYISYIIIFYLLYPLVYKHILPSKKKTIGIFLVTFLVQLAVLIVNLDAYRNCQLALSRMPITILGCALGKMVYEDREFKIRLPLYSLAVFAMMWVVRMLGIIDLSDGWITLYDKTSNMFAVFGFCLLYPIVCGKLSDHSKLPLCGILKKALLWIGKHSLEIYLVHVALYFVFVSYGFTNVKLYWLVVLPLTVALAYIDKLLVTKIVKR